MTDADLLLSPGELEEICSIKSGIESKFEVLIRMPDIQTVNLETDHTVVNVSGPPENLSSAVQFLHTYVFRREKNLHKYPRPLEIVFSQIEWRRLLEQLHDVIIVHKSLQTLLLFGAGVTSALSALNNLSSSLNTAFNLYSQQYYFKLLDEINQSVSVPISLKEVISETLRNLPQCTSVTLLLWVKQYAEQLIQDSADDDEFIEVLEVPKKKIVLITLSDDDQEGSGNAISQSTNDTVTTPKTTVVLTRDSAAKNVSPIPPINNTPPDVIARKESKNSKKKKKLKKHRQLSSEIPTEALDYEALPETSQAVVKQKRKQKDTIEIAMNPAPPCNLRPIVIDGNSVSLEYGRPYSLFSCKGVQICIQYFMQLGHTDITAFVSQYRRRVSHKQTVGQEILEQLNLSHLVVFTPSRIVNGKTISSHNDRFILELACKKNGIVVSNNNLRNLMQEKEEWKKAVEERQLMFCFIGDTFMIPEDPLGKDGPNIKEFLSFPSS